MPELAARPAEQTIVAAIVAMAHSLRLRVTAEGIETTQQLEQVRALGCDAAQGFLLARPAAPEQVASLLHRPLGPHPVEVCRGVGDDDDLDAVATALPAGQPL